MLFNLLTSSAGDTTSANPWTSYIMLGILAVIIIAFMVLNRNSQKKRQEEATKMLNAIQPGAKVKTIGGICGVVVEVCPEDNTFVLETGTEASGKSYIKFDKQAVYQTDAVAQQEETAPVEEAAEEELFEEAQQPVADEEVVAEETVEETEETSAEETTEE